MSIIETSRWGRLYFRPGTSFRALSSGTVFRTTALVATYTNAVRIGYALVSGTSQDHQTQLDALSAADCRKVVVETASTRGERPRLREVLAELQSGDTSVVYKPDRIARLLKEGSAWWPTRCRRQ